jgi:hypothetical protein
MSEEKAEYGATAVQVRTEVEAMAAKANAMLIASEQDRGAAGDIIREAKRRMAALSASFDESVKAAHGAWKAAVVHRDKFLAPLEALEKILKAKCAAYDRDQAGQRAEEERKARAEAESAAERERQRLLKEADRRKTDEAKERLIEQAEAVVAAPVDLPPEPTKRAGESYATSYDVEIVVASLVPREYCLIDLQALRKVGNATKGKLEIPGVRWIEKKTLRVRL